MCVSVGQVKRTEGSIKLKSSGEEFKVTKGAPHIILKLIKDKAVVEVRTHRRREGLARTYL